MNVRYSHEFKGMDGILNRFEILTESVVKSVSVEATANPFALDYGETRKLEPVRGSQATIELISESIFQFVDLHTGDMQKYLVKFYRAGVLYWVGWLDPEIYGEELSATPPYNVTFKASDFNVLERLKYLDESDKTHTDIVSFITHLKRCLSKLGLPFQKLYIGCTTSINGVSIPQTETALHVLYMMSSNFYDEDNEPMKCREVVESLIQPLGLMMVQKNSNVFIYDYNTIKKGLPLKRYNFSTFTYEADEVVLFNLGEMSVIGFRSIDSSYGFEEMINNASVTSSIYADASLFEGTIGEKTLSQKKSTIVDEARYKIDYYEKDENIENLTKGDFVIYTDKENDSTMEGALLPYTPKDEIYNPLFRAKCKSQFLLGGSDYFVNIKMKAYANTRTNPFDSKEKEPGDTSQAKAIFLYCNLYTVDENNKPLWSYSNRGLFGGWWSIGPTGSIQQGQCELLFVEKEVWDGFALNKWMTNSDLPLRTMLGERYPITIPHKNYTTGQNVALTSAINGYLVLEVVNGCKVDHPGGEGYPYMGIKNVFINDITLSVKNKNKEDISTDDYEFKSYIDKKVATDLEEVTLKCISANEEKAPIGKANILKKVDNRYELQLGYTRAGQTDILERLLMCTIHSNFTTKNEKMTVDIKMTDNPALSYVSYQPILSGSYLITGCTLNFAEAKTTITAVGYSEDTAKLSNIPYE